MAPTFFPSNSFDRERTWIFPRCVYEGSVFDRPQGPGSRGRRLCGQSSISSNETCLSACGIRERMPRGVRRLGNPPVAAPVAILPRKTSGPRSAPPGPPRRVGVGAAAGPNRRPRVLSAGSRNKTTLENPADDSDSLGPSFPGAPSWTPGPRRQSRRIRSPLPVPSYSLRFPSPCDPPVNDAAFRGPKVVDSPIRAEATETPSRPAAQPRKCPSRRGCGRPTSLGRPKANQLVRSSLPHRGTTRRRRNLFPCFCGCGLNARPRPSPPPLISSVTGDDEPPTSLDDCDHGG